MKEYLVKVTYKATRDVWVHANSKSEARIKAVSHDVEDVQDDFDLIPVSAGKAIELVPLPDTSNFRL